VGNEYCFDLVIPAPSADVREAVEAARPLLKKAGFEPAGGAPKMHAYDDPPHERAVLDCSIPFTPLTSYRRQVLENAFARSLADRDAQPWREKLEPSLWVSTFKNALHGSRLGGPAWFAALHFYAVLRVGEEYWDPALYRLLADRLDPLLSTGEVDFLQFYDEGDDGQFEFSDEPFPIARADYHRMGAIGFIRPYMQDGITEHILGRLERWEYDEDGEREEGDGLRKEELQQLGFKPVVRLSDGSARFATFTHVSVRALAESKG
jgi:hypothetical protein